jgi:nicotinamide riboside kinase
LKENGTQYGYEDLEIIARRQLQLEDTMTSQAAGTDFLFIDTNMLVMQVWYEYVYKHCPPFIMEEHMSRGYDLYLLCYPDLPWVSDGMREYPDEKIRLELFEIYRSKLEKQNANWQIVSGLGAERLKCAISAINVHFDS